MFHPNGPTFFELAQQALSSTERGYDLLAPKFDFTPFRTPDLVLEAVEKVVERQGPIARAVDVCCGTGAGMQMLRPHAAEVVGLDMSQGMLDVAEKNSADWPGEGQLTFLRRNVLTDPLDDLEPFDAAVCFGALGHIPVRDEKQFLNVVYHRLRPGGRFYFVSSLKPPWYSLSAMLARSFNAAMHIRNVLVRPPFIMFYLTFLLPRVEATLTQSGFEVVVHEGDFPEVLSSFRVVEAIRPADD